MEEYDPEYDAPEIAASAAERGWKVFPVILTKDGKKIPAIKGWQTRATNKLDPIYEWFKLGRVDDRRMTGLLVGLAMQPVNPGFFALDIDIKKGKDGRKALRALQGDEPDIETWGQHTLTGGIHFLLNSYRHKVYNSTSSLGPGLDVRGQGGLIALYEPVDSAEVEFAPEWLMKVLKKAGAGKAQDYGQEELKTTGKGTSQNAAFHWALKLVHAGFDGKQTLFDMLRAAGCNIPEAELVHAVESAMKYRGQTRDALKVVNKIAKVEGMHD